MSIGLLVCCGVFSLYFFSPFLTLCMIGFNGIYPFVGYGFSHICECVSSVRISPRHWSGVNALLTCKNLFDVWKKYTRST